eukprot:gb/GECH01011469.1/.p1 GENE.gb/GECH01011469.1/~~gb/GECH01011469.1/.p1  ORF type:complete len:105 (+),score=17.19 gb/GECH01011469.1/:1-315(+)
MPNSNMNSNTSISQAEKYDHCLENTLRKTSLGFLYAFVPSLVLTRNFIPRVAVCAFGGGMGFGMAYSECRYLFEKGTSFQRRVVADVKYTPDSSSSSSSATSSQ